MSQSELLIHTVRALDKNGYGGSEKQLFDAARVYDLQQEVLDTGYFETWLRKLNLKEQFAAMQRYL